MPSPMAHAAVGYAIGRAWAAPRFGVTFGGRAPYAGVVLATVALSLLPDLDAAVGILAGDLGRYHNNLAGSPTFGALVALLVAGAAALWRRDAAGPCFLGALVCYEAHVLMDFFTVGRGVMLAWPLSTERFHPPFHLFYGLRWSDGWLSWRHVWTLVTELGSVLVVVGLVEWRVRRGAPRQRIGDGR